MSPPLSVSVRLEDIDATGFVAADILLRYLARARSEYFVWAGKSQAAWEAEGLRFPVYRIEARFPGAARLEDRLRIHTTAQAISPFRIGFNQRIERGAERIAEAIAEVVLTDRDGKLLPVPEGVFGRDDGS